jgi:hypothetical protein
MLDQGGLSRISFASSRDIAIIAAAAAFTWTGLIWLVVRIIS